MLRSEIEKKTGLTRKAIEYYERKKLISPVKVENGYREYSEQELLMLQKISLYRKLGLSLEDITLLLEENSTSKIAAILRNRQVILGLEKKKQLVLEKLMLGEDISEDLKSIEKEELLYTKLIQAFPGYFGQLFFSMYQPFLNEPLTEENASAFYDFIDFIDRLPALPLTPSEVELIENATKTISLQDMAQFSADRIHSIQHFDEWIKKNESTIQDYFLLKESDEFKKSPIFHIQAKLKAYMEANQYYNTALPLLRKFSRSYREYYEKMLLANEKLIHAGFYQSAD